MLKTVPLNLVIIQEEPADDYHSPRPTLIDNNSHRHETCSLPSEPLTASISDKADKGRIFGSSAGISSVGQAEERLVSSKSGPFTTELGPSSDFTRTCQR